jgi:hypothetical protein
MIILGIGVLTRPVEANTPLTYGVQVNDIIEYRFTKINGDITAKEKKSILFTLWLDWEGGQYPNGTFYDESVPRGLYLGEILTLKITTVPNDSGCLNPLSCNGDFPEGIFQTPREMTTGFVSPYIFTLPFIIPLNPDISEAYPHLLFDEQGILTRANQTIKHEKGELETILELTTNTPSITPPIDMTGIILSLVMVILLTNPHQKRVEK